MNESLLVTPAQSQLEFDQLRFLHLLEAYLVRPTDLLFQEMVKVSTQTEMLSLFYQKILTVDVKPLVLKQAISLFIDEGRFQEAAYYAERLTKIEPSSESWRIQGIIACYQKNLALLAQVYEELERIYAPSDILQTFHTAWLLLAGQSQTAAEFVKASFVQSERDSFRNWIILEIALETNDVEVLQRLPLNKNFGYSENDLKQMLRLLRNHFLQILSHRQRSL